MCKDTRTKKYITHEQTEKGEFRKSERPRGGVSCAITQAHTQRGKPQMHPKERQQKKSNKQNRASKGIRVLTVALLCKDNKEQPQTQKRIRAKTPKRKQPLTVLSVRVLRHKKREIIHKRDSANCERQRGVQVHIYTYGIDILK